MSHPLTPRPAWRRPAWRWAVEPLEGRSLLSTYTWTSAVDGQYTDASKWTGPGGVHAVPGPGDDAVTPAGTYTITSSGSETLDTFNGGAELDVAGGTFTLTNSSADAESTISVLDVAAGATLASTGGETVLNSGQVDGQVVNTALLTLGFNGTTNAPLILNSANALAGTGQYDIFAGLQLGADTTAPANLDLGTDGTITLGDHTLTIASGLIVGGGEITGGTLQVNHGATVSFAGAAIKTLDALTVDNYGAVTWDDTGDIAASGLRFENESVGSFVVTNDQSLTGTTGAGQNFFDNDGTFIKTSANENVTNFAVEFHNGFLYNGSGYSEPNPRASLEISSGTLEVSSMDNGATISLGARDFLQVDGDLTEEPATSLLSVQVGGVSTSGLFGQVLVGGTASLAGSLDVGNDGGYRPINGQVYPILGPTFPTPPGQSVTGQFQSFNYTGLNPGTTYTPTQTAQGLSLTVVSNNKSGVPGDFDGDGKTDIALYDQSGGTFFIVKSAGSSIVQPFGNPDHVNLPVVGDFDGDGRADIAIYDQTAAEFFILKSNGGTIVQPFGNPHDVNIPVAGDFDGDGKADLAIYDQTLAEFFVVKSGGGTIVQPFGNPHDVNIPVAGDFDGDGKTDIAIYDQTASAFYVVKSGGGTIAQPFGDASHVNVPVAGDFDGDGKTDLAIYDQTAATFFVVESAGGTIVQPLGNASLANAPIAGDYDGDGRTDLAIFDQTDAIFFVVESGGGTLDMPFGNKGHANRALSR